MKKQCNLLALIFLGLLVSGITGCREDEESAPDALLRGAAEHPMEHPVTNPATQAPKDHPAH